MALLTSRYIQRLTFQKWAMTLLRFSPRLLISSVKQALVTTSSAKRRIWFTLTNKEMCSRRCYDAHELWNGELRRQASGSQLKTWSLFEWPLQSLRTSAFLSARAPFFLNSEELVPAKEFMWFCFSWDLQSEPPSPQANPANVDMNNVMDWWYKCWHFRISNETNFIPSNVWKFIYLFHITFNNLEFIVIFTYISKKLSMLPIYTKGLQLIMQNTQQ